MGEGLPTQVNTNIGANGGQSRVYHKEVLRDRALFQGDGADGLGIQVSAGPGQREYGVAAASSPQSARSQPVPARSQMLRCA